MGCRILLLSANQCTIPDPVFPLGLSYLDSALRKAGHDCLWVDCLSDTEALPEKVKNYRPDFVGISIRNIDDVLIRHRETFFTGVPSLTAMLRREVSCPVILGGSGFSIFPERLLEVAGADFGLIGEGETALPALIGALDAGTDYGEIPGLVFRRDGRILANPSVPSRFDLELSDSNRPEPIVTHYLRSGGMLNVQTQRGCGFRCAYCTYPLIEGRQHRRRAPELVAEEFGQLQRLGARYVFIVDSVFNSSPRHVVETCEALLKHNLTLSWGCFLRPQGLTAELVRLMKRAGLKHIEFGSDSFCDEVLAAYQKGFHFDNILHSSELAREAEVDYCHYIIAGGPGETTETMQDGFENSLNLPDPVIMAVVGMRIYPGTDLYARAVSEGRIPPRANVLEPSYYVAPGLTADEVFAKLEEFSRRSPNWIVGDPAPRYHAFIQRLRERGVVGPLWSYLALMQRLNPAR